MKLKFVISICLSIITLQGFCSKLEYGFESDFEDWHGRGAATISLSSEYAHSGSQSLFVTDRTSSWNGAYMQNDYVQAGKTYKFSCYVLTTKDVKMDMSVQYTIDGNASYPAVANTTAKAGTWLNLSGEITIPDDATDIQPYVQCPGDATLSFYIDDFVCEAEAEEEVDFSVQPSLKELFADYFRIGTAATASEITPDNAKNLVLRHFNSLTPGNELKPDCLLDQAASMANGDNTNPQVKLPASTKTVLKFCSENNIPIRGHVFVWHSQTPDWFFNAGFESVSTTVTADIMDKRMENYIKNVVEMVTTNYPDLQIFAWDVVNEAFKDGDGSMRDAGSNNITGGTSRWMEIYSDTSFIYKAFSYARKYVPEGCKIYYNDFNEYMQSKRDGIYTLVKDLYAKGLCDGVGMQSHLSTSYPSVATYKEAVEKYATIGCDIQITELDITLSGSADFNTQAKMYKDLFDIYRSHKDQISLVTFWGMNDETSWRKSGKPLIFSKYQPKEAYWRIIEDWVERDTTAVADREANSDIVVNNSNGMITVAANGLFSYMVTNIAGQVILKGNGNDNAEFAISANKSVYIVTVTTADGTRKSVKIMKQ